MEIDIKATLILCGEDMLIERGQHLMVVGNVCVGVYTGELPGSVPQRPSPSSASATKRAIQLEVLPYTEGLKPLPAKGKPKKQQTPRKPQSPPAPHIREITAEKILSVFQPDEKLTPRMVGDRLRVPGSDDAGKSRIWRLMEQMTTQRILIRSDKLLPGSRSYAFTVGEVAVDQIKAAE